MLKNLIQEFPDKPGVYLMKDSEGKILYVGKAISLKKRVNTYFQSEEKIFPHIKSMLDKVKTIETILTDSETEALILENNLIKQFNPRYNTRLKDAKTYPFIKITIREEYPRFIITRNLENDGSIYYGPYTDVKAVRKTLHFIRRYFPVAVCTSEIEAKKNRPCIEFQINRCSAPCSDIISRNEYLEIVEKVRNILEGRHQKLIRNLLESINLSSSKRDFEKAASYRDQLKLVNRIVEKQKIVSVGGKDQDIIAIVKNKGKASAQVFLLREGTLIDRKQFIMDGVLNVEFSQIISSFIKLYYSDAQQIPEEIIVQNLPEEIKLIHRWLLSKGKTIIRVPYNTREKDLLSMVQRNAAHYLKQRINLSETSNEDSSRILKDVKKVLQLNKNPIYIEAFDISNIQGSNAVGSTVVFENGAPVKNKYRRFRIKNVRGVDDYKMMSEIVRRRYLRLLREKSSFPNLILIDGGKGHLKVINEELNKIGINDIPVIALAKSQEEIFSSKFNSSLILPRDSQALIFLERIRDEAHRFALNYHKQLRRISLSKSIFDSILGIGENKKKLLLKQFKNVDNLKKARIEEIAVVKGIGFSTAEKIHKFLQEYKK